MDIICSLYNWNNPKQVKLNLGITILDILFRYLVLFSTLMSSVLPRAYSGGLSW